MNKFLSFNDSSRFAEVYPETILTRYVSAAQHKAVQRLVEKSYGGAILVPGCYLIAGIVSGFYNIYPVPFLVIALSLIAGAVFRIRSIQIIKKEDHRQTMWQNVFFISSCLMALSWGLIVVCYLYVYNLTFSFYLCLVMSAGIGAGVVANYSPWRNLACMYLLLMNIPPAIMAVFFRDVQMVSVMFVFIFYMIYMFSQVKYRNREYWQSLITGVLYEAQARDLEAINKELENNIKEQRLAGEELEISRQKMRDLFDNASSGIVIYDLKGIVLDVNTTCKNMFGFSKNDFPPLWELHQLTAPDSISIKFMELLEKTACEEKNEFEWHTSAKQSACSFWVFVNMRKVTWQNDDIIFITIHDIDDRKTAELERDLAKETLMKSEGNLRAILENSSMPIFCKDLQGKYLTVNSRFEMMAQRPAVEIIGLRDKEIFPSKIAEMFSKNDERVKKEKISVETEGVFVLGEDKYSLLIITFPLYQDEEGVYGTGTICTDITSLKQAYFEMKKANKAKAEFLANISHELKTPLHGILSYGRLARKKVQELSKDELAVFLEKIIGSGAQLLDLLNDLLDMSRLDAGKMNYSFKSGDMVADIQDVMQAFSGTAQEKGVEIKTCFREDGEELYLEYDRARIRQVLRNLISNSVKFSTKGSTVTVKVEKTFFMIAGEHRPGTKVCVIDQGIGIPVQELDAVFEEFIQSTLTQDGSGGSGLGLAISKKIIEGHHGKIWAEQNRDKGTTITFILPRNAGGGKERK